MLKLVPPPRVRYVWTPGIPRMRQCCECLRLRNPMARPWLRTRCHTLLAWTCRCQTSRAQCGCRRSRRQAACPRCTVPPRRFRRAGEPPPTRCLPCVEAGIPAQPPAASLTVAAEAAGGRVGIRVYDQLTPRVRASCRLGSCASRRPRGWTTSTAGAPMPAPATIPGGRGPLPPLAASLRCGGAGRDRTWRSPALPATCRAFGPAARLPRL